MTCQTCGAALSSEARFCDQCGATQHMGVGPASETAPGGGVSRPAGPVPVPQLTPCLHCTAPLAVTAEYCAHCGNWQSASGWAATSIRGVMEPTWPGPGPAAPLAYGWSPYPGAPPPAAGFDLMKFGTFDGRIGRGAYWALVVPAQLLFYVSWGLFTAGPGSGAQIVLSLALIAGGWVTFSATIKRWHDRNKSGWWLLIGLIPIIGSLWAFIETGCLAGTDGKNDYGWPSDGSPFGS